MPTIGFSRGYCERCECFTSHRVVEIITTTGFSDAPTITKKVNAYCTRSLQRDERRWANGLAIPKGSECGWSMRNEVRLAVAEVRARVMSYEAVKPWQPIS